MYTSPIKSPAPDTNGAGTGLYCLSVMVAAVTFAMAAAFNFELLMDIAAICKDFIVFGRMFQEGTIDAAKTGANIVIAYASNIRDNIKLLSRIEDKLFGFDIDWHLCPKKKERTLLPSGKIVEVEVDRENVIMEVDQRKEGWHTIPLGDQGKTKSIYLVRDEYFKLECEALEVVKSFAEEMVTAERPEFSSALLGHIDAKREGDKIFNELCVMARFIKDNTYSVLTNAQNIEIRNQWRRYSNPKDRDQAVSETRKEYRAYFDLLANEYRKTFDYIGKTCRYGISRQEIILAALDASFRDKNGKFYEDEADASTFADNILQEEFTIFMLNMMRKKGEEIFEIAEEELAVCTFNARDEAEFIFGEAVVTDENGNIIKHAITKHNCRLTGKYTIGFSSDGKWVAKKSIYDKLKEPQPDYSKAIYITVPVPEGTGHFVELAKVAADNEINFVQYRNINGAECRENIACNGVVYGRYRVLRSKSTNDKVKTAFDYVGTYSKNGVSGKLEKLIPYRYTDSNTGKKMECAILVMDDMHSNKEWVAIRSVNGSTQSAVESVEEEALMTGEDW